MILGRFTKFVPGRAAPQGSMVGLWSESEAKVVMKASAAGLHAWREDIGWIIRGEMNRHALVMAAAGIAVGLQLHFNLWSTTPHLGEAMILAPDLDKLSRAVLDALTGILYVDDRQVDALSATKAWAGSLPLAGVTIHATIGTCP